MTPQDSQAILTLALLAAFADGGNSEAERAEVKRIADSLSASGEVNLAAIYQEVLMKRASVESAAAQLTSTGARTLAYEMAVCVCDADGAQSATEKRFLAELAQRLGLDANTSADFSARAESFAAAPLAAVSSAEPPPLAPSSSIDQAELDKMVLNYAILNGALELLPDTLASMTIIPLQMKMVYRVGRAHGYELDRGHVKDLLATAGVGMASQYLERAGVKLIGKVFGKGLVGGLIGGIAKQAVSSGMSFGTTYALGHLANRYYAGGRTFSAAVIKDTYQSLLGEAKALEGQYLPAMRAKAQTIDLGELLREVGR